MMDDEPFESDPDEFASRLAGSHKASGPSLKARAIDFLSRREHSRVELQRKLQRHTDDLDAIESLLDDLERERWLSDERFAHSLINRKAHKLGDRKSTRLNSSHVKISYAVFCLKKKKKIMTRP